MGDIKNFRKDWNKPKRPLNFELKMEELKILGTFGLKTKRELWKARTELSRVRNQARSLLALRQEVREKEEPILIHSLSRIGLVEQNATLDDVLNLEINDLLSRRLQTIIMKKFYFKTPYQARQAISHGHILIGDRVVNIPSYVVKVDEEEQVKLTPESIFNKILSKPEPESELGSPETENIEIKEVSTEEKISADEKPATEEKISADEKPATEEKPSTE
jgi:small subunit ribosomal protein S4